MNRTANNAIKVKYDGMNNITYECLKRGVIFADIGFDESDMIMDIVPTRHYEGKTPNDEAKIGFIISIKSDYFDIALQEKIVFEIDGDRIEVGISGETVRKRTYRAFDEECTYSQEEIIGINGYVFEDTDFDKVLFDLQSKDIKRIAEAKNVCIYFDSDVEYNVNGGNIALRNDNGSCQIEGIQGAMKRAYHYFVDENCYADYCASFLERKHKILEEEKQEQEQQRIQEEQAEQEEKERWRKKRNRTLIILVVSLVFIGIGGSAPFLGFVGFVGGSYSIYSIIKLVLLYHIDE